MLLVDPGDILQVAGVSPVEAGPVRARRKCDGRSTRDGELVARYRLGVRRRTEGGREGRAGTELRRCEHVPDGRARSVARRRGLHVAMLERLHPRIAGGVIDNAGDRTDIAVRCPGSDFVVPEETHPYVAGLERA